ncbi:uncharacterized protein [Primulina eburnea]|uniref:uncharacterized protein n=1 Tax=Primulina eburnea TaxID=1245227 RepID=UPI003C6CA195
MGKSSSKLRGDLHGLRCQHCAGPLSKEMETSEWTVSSLIRDSFSMIGSAVGGTAGAFYGFHHGPTRHCFLIRLCWINRWIYSALVQLASSSYHAVVSSSPSPPRSSS